MRSSWAQNIAKLILNGSMLWGSLPLPSAVPSGPWIAFRYDASRVLFYLGEMRDPAKFTQQAVERQQAKDPIARWGSGGYLIPLTPARWATFQPYSNTKFPEIRHGDHVSILLNGATTVSGTVEGFLEQWGMSNPIVEVGVRARVSSDQLRAFRAAKSNYFLAYSGAESMPPSSNAADLEMVGRRRVLNRFGPLGELVLVDGEKGWIIRLWRRTNGRLAPTAVSYAYGD